MKKVALFCVLFTGLFGALWFVQRRREKMTSVILSRYPRTPLFAHVVDSHLRGLGLSANLPLKIPSKGNPVLLTTDFSKRHPGSPRWYDMDNSGFCVGYLERSSTTYPGGFPPASYMLDSNTHLSNAQLKSVRHLLKQMPENNLPASRDDLVLVSFTDGKQWKTQVYDKTALPTPVKKLLVLLGRRSE